MMKPKMPMMSRPMKKRMPMGRPMMEKRPRRSFGKGMKKMGKMDAR